MKLARLFLMSMLVCTVVSGARKFPLAAATSVPAARGDVEISHDKNGNTKFKIKVQHLAEPSNLAPPKTAYVVWLQERGGNAEAQGQLKVDKKLNASFTGVTPAKNFDILITAEQETSPKAPTGEEVLKATIQP
jgi:hypothetical protein